MGNIKVTDMKHCPRCGKKLDSEHDLFWDIREDILGCTYCMKDKIEEHVKWCDEWRKEHRSE